ncbi:hypothetical protein BD309DRAFT_974747 [Dichomitus squalens]|nr:hypothetical protein BD309DRAFT_974747 [Dichomitus squalens]
MGLSGKAQLVIVFTIACARRILTGQAISLRRATQSYTLTCVKDLVIVISQRLIPPPS